MFLLLLPLSPVRHGWWWCGSRGTLRAARDRAVADPGPVAHRLSGFPAFRLSEPDGLTGIKTGSNVNRERKCFSAAIRPDLAAVDGQIAQRAGGMAVVPDNGEPLSPQAADLVRRIAHVFLDEPAVCVPRTSSTSCDQAVFVDHAADASVSPDVVSLNIDWFG